MGLYIDYDQMRDTHTEIYKYLSDWEDNLVDIGSAKDDILENRAMEGKSADNIYAYMREIHTSLISTILRIITFFSDKMVIAEGLIYEIDRGTYAVIPEEEIDEMMLTHYLKMK